VIQVPTITYRGPRKTGANCGRLGWWTWGAPREVSAEWLEANRKAIDGPEFRIEGHTWATPEKTVDAGNDGIPDMGWTKGDIMAWMEEKGLSYGSLSTKKKMLDAIDAHLNPQVEEAPEEESTE